MIKSKRIDKITSFVFASVTAEIGADHGYITKQLLDNSKINFGFLTDISNKSLEKAQKNLSKYKDRTMFLVGDGLTVFDDLKFEIKPQQIIIAGMGGLEIIKILSKNKLFKNFILQPQKNVLELKQYLIDNNYKIEQDEVVKEGKQFYFVLKVKKSNKKFSLTEKEIMFGKTNLKNRSQDFVDYLLFQKNFCEEILKIKHVEEISNKYKLICEILKHIKEKTNV